MKPSHCFVSWTLKWKPSVYETALDTGNGRSLKMQIVEMCSCGGEFLLSSQDVISLLDNYAFKQRSSNLILVGFS